MHIWNPMKYKDELWIFRIASEVIKEMTITDVCFSES